MNTFMTQLKREYWENRGGFTRTPLIVAGAILAITIMGLVVGQKSFDNDFKFFGKHVIAGINHATPEMVENVQRGVFAALAVSSLLLQFALGIVLFFYLLGALFDERKDRSVLFWKSMPVSDLQTVLIKIFAATVLAPVIAVVVTIVFNVLTISIMWIFMSANGFDAGKFLWAPSAIIKQWVGLLTAIPVNAIWALPSIGWLLLVSSWARSKPFLWAVVVPLVLGFLVFWFDALSNLRIPDTWYWKEVFARGLLSIFPWTFDAAAGFRFGFDFSPRSGPADLVAIAPLIEVLSSIRTWIGAVAGIAMISAAVYFRRYRELGD
jgi:ABC-2 type transport system permease protein